MSGGEPKPKVSLWSLGPTVYIPTLIYAIGQGAFTPVVVLSAFELGATLETAGLLVALVGIGLIIGDVPAGTLTDRIGERPAMVASSVLAVAGLSACIVADSIFVLGIGVLVTGMSTAVWGVARQVYVTEVVPYGFRARALSLLAGINRIGMFVGPLLGAVAISLMGLDGAYWVYLGAAVIAALILLVLPDLPHRANAAPRPAHGGTLDVIRDNWGILRTLGFAVVLVGVVRESRRVLIPLWGTYIGLDAPTISIVFGLSGGADMLLFYPAGKLMDVAGRWWAAIPSFLILGVAHIALLLAESAVGLALVAVLLGVGNGLSSGIIMTLGADASPKVGRPQFLGAWRMCHDVGRGIGPVLISGIIGVATIGAAAVTIGGAALVAAGALHRWIPSRESSRRAAAAEETP